MSNAFLVCNFRFFLNGQVKWSMLKIRNHIFKVIFFVKISRWAVHTLENSTFFLLHTCLSVSTLTLHVCQVPLHIAKSPEWKKPMTQLMCGQEWKIKNIFIEDLRIDARIPFEKDQKKECTHGVFSPTRRVKVSKHIHNFSTYKFFIAWLLCMCVWASFRSSFTFKYLRFGCVRFFWRIDVYFFLSCLFFFFFFAYILFCFVLVTTFPFLYIDVFLCVLMRQRPTTNRQRCAHAHSQIVDFDNNRSCYSSQMPFVNHL